MARYDITSLNYINVGSNRVFFNFDSQISYTLNRELHSLRSENDENILIGTIVDNVIKYELITENEKYLKTEDNDYQIILENYHDEYYKPDGTHTVFSPVLSNDTDEYFQKTVDFNNKRRVVNNTYIGEYFQTNCQKRMERSQAC